MMIPSVLLQSRQARATQLKLELEDAAKRMPGLSPEMQLKFALHLAASARHARDSSGAFLSIAAEQKLKIAEQFRELGRESFDSSPGRGYANFIISALYESDALPGDDAMFVRSTCAEFIIAATKVERNFKEAEQAGMGAPSEP